MSVVGAVVRVDDTIHIDVERHFHYSQHPLVVSMSQLINPIHIVRVCLSVVTIHVFCYYSSGRYVYSTCPTNWYQQKAVNVRNKINIVS